MILWACDIDPNSQLPHSSGAGEDPIPRPNYSHEQQCKGVSSPAVLPVLVFFQLSESSPVWGLYIGIYCISLIIVERQCLFTCLLAFLVCSSEKSLFTRLAHFPTGLDPFFLVNLPEILGHFHWFKTLHMLFLCQLWHFIYFRNLSTSSGFTNL